MATSPATATSLRARIDAADGATLLGLWRTVVRDDDLREAWFTQMKRLVGPEPQPQPQDTDTHSYQGLRANIRRAAGADLTGLGRQVALAAQDGRITQEQVELLDGEWCARLRVLVVPGD